ncbi:MAG: heme ABC transporter permease [Pseudomonadota bacterium]
MHRFANPARFGRLARSLLPWLWVATAGLFTIGLYLALIASPVDYQQGDTVRIMYVHVPAAWLALFAYSSMAGANIVGFIWRHPLAFLAAKAIAPLGAGFTFICLASGSLWGKPMWGAFWVWDARLTSMLVLLFLYIGYMVLVSAFDDAQRGLKAAGILSVVGLVNLPIIKFSVDWWNTLHQPASVSRLGAPAMPAEMLTPLMVMAGAFFCLFAALVLVRTLGEIDLRKLQIAQARLASEAKPGAPAGAVRAAHQHSS